MSVTRLRGGVTATSRDDPSHALNNPDEWDLMTLPNGGIQAHPTAGFWRNAMPYLWAAGMGAGAGLNAGLFDGVTGGAGGAGSGVPAASSTAPGLPGEGGGMDILGWLKGGDKSGISGLYKLIAAAGGLKDLFGGNDEDADWATFENEFRGGRSLDPRDLMAQGLQQTERAGMAAGERAKTPVRLRSSYVQQPSVMTGGGLPMPIGLTGQDPGVTDPSLLSAEGALSDNPFDEADAALELLRSRG